MSYLPTVSSMIRPLVVPEPTIVYHYTSVDTLMKIVESRQVRATNVGYLNDSKEREMFLEAAENRLPEFLQQNQDVDAEAFSSFTEARADAYVSDYLPFTASFCRDGDSLPQWRAYCAGGNGVSIGFNVACLKGAVVAVDSSFVNGDESPLTSTPAFGAVEYLGKFSTYKVDSELRAASAKLAEPGGFLAALFPLVHPSLRVRWALEERATLYKNEAFSSELEYRLVVPEMENTPGVVHFRSNKWTLVPYVNLDVPHKDGTFRRANGSGKYIKTGWDAIAAVCVGPTADKEVTRRSLTSYFQTRGMTVDISVTENTYREW